MRRLLVIGHLSLVICLSAFAQSNLTYELKVGTTGEVKLLEEFPESYAGEKVNITVTGYGLQVTGYGLQVTGYGLRDIEALDFVFASEDQPRLADRFDSIYSYTDEAEVA